MLSVTVSLWWGQRPETTNTLKMSARTNPLFLDVKSLNNPVKNDNISGILKYKLYLTSPRLDWPNFLSTLIIERGQVLTNQRPRIEPSANQRPVAAPYCSISWYYDQLTITDQIKSLQAQYSGPTLPLTPDTRRVKSVSHARVIQVEIHPQLSFENWKLNISTAVCELMVFFNWSIFLHLSF